MLESSSVKDTFMLEEPLDRIEVKIDRMTSQVDGLHGKVDGLEAKIETLTSRVEGLDTRVHRLTVINEDIRDDVRRIADRVAGTSDRFDRIERGVDEIKSTMNSFIQTQSAINGKLRSRDADHERRIVALEKRPS